MSTNSKIAHLLFLLYDLKAHHNVWVRQLMSIYIDIYLYIQTNRSIVCLNRSPMIYLIVYSFRNRKIFLLPGVLNDDIKGFVMLQALWIFAIDITLYLQYYCKRSYIILQKKQFSMHLGYNCSLHVWYNLTDINIALYNGILGKNILLLFIQML